MSEMRYVSHPGVYIKDAIESLGMSQNEFACRTGLTSKNVSTLINGSSSITFEVATKLASFFDNSVEGWINLQTKYDMYLNQEKVKAQYKEDYEIVKMFDNSFLKDYLQIEKDPKNKENIIDSLRKLLNVGYLSCLKENDMYAFCKTSIQKDLTVKNIVLRNAWISLAENSVRDLKIKEFDYNKIKENIQVLRSFTLKKPKEFVPKLHATLNNCGIKLVILPYLSGSNISGVTKWNDNDKTVLIAINDCGKDADKFWFTLFHELGHALANHKRHLTLSFENGKIKDAEEIEADNFARNALINDYSYEQFTSKGDFSLGNITNFAIQESVAPFVIIGRLQKDGFIPWSCYSDLKIKYKIVNQYVGL